MNNKREGETPTIKTKNMSKITNKIGKNEEEIKENPQENLVINGKKKNAPLEKKKYPLGIVRITWKKNNIFMNVHDIKGKTIIKFSSGLVQKNSNKKNLFSIAKFLLNKVRVFIKNNFYTVRIIIKGGGLKSLALIKQLQKQQKQQAHEKQKKEKIWDSKIIYFENKLPLVHNGCRLPKKRRL